MNPSYLIFLLSKSPNFGIRYWFPKSKSTELSASWLTRTISGFNVLSQGVGGISEGLQTNISQLIRQIQDTPILPAITHKKIGESQKSF